MKNLTVLFFFFTVVGFAQTDLYVSNNANVSVYVDGAGFDDAIAGNVPLFVTNNINLAGANSIIYLRNEAQLLQGNDIDNIGTGYLERGQKGSASLYNYNYWGSPVWSATEEFTIGSILFDGTDLTDVNNIYPILWTPGTDAIYVLGAMTMSSYWLFAYDNNTINDYDAWEPKDENDPFHHGLGFTMKGSGSGPGTATQNYMFRGIPNNGTIINDVSVGNQTLVGNPYPSAIDAREFIKDNIPLLNPDNTPSPANPGTSESIDGTLNFWRQSTTVGTHYLAVYQGGYATYDLSGGVAAATIPSEIGGPGDAGLINYTPRDYIPVAQGFFVNAAATADQVTEEVRFKNSQRFFKKEALTVSVFLEPNDLGSDNRSHTIQNREEIDDIQRVRLTYKTPEGAIRYLLLAFTQNNEASDGFDYGYDAINNEDTLPSDLNWNIEDKNYIIQGVGRFNINKEYPLNMLVGEKGTVEIALTELENFDSDIDVFVYDALYKTYTKLNEVDYFNNLEADTYNDRFFITFKNDAETLDIAESNINSFSIFQNNSKSELTIINPKSINISGIGLFDVVGKEVFENGILETKTEYYFSTKNLSDGVYIAKLQLKNNVLISKKVIVINK